MPSSVADAPVGKLTLVGLGGLGRRRPARAAGAKAGERQQPVPRLPRMAGSALSGPLQG